MRGGSGTRQRLCCCHHRQGPGTRHELIGDLPPPTEALLKRQPMAASPAAAPHTMAMRSAQANVVAITQPRSSLRPRVSSLWLRAASASLGFAPRCYFIGSG